MATSKRPGTGAAKQTKGRARGRPVVLVTLAEVREKRALSLRDLASLSSVSYVTIWRIEQGQSVPALRTRRKLADALKVDVASIGWPQ